MAIMMECGNMVAILPITHPRNGYYSAIRGVIESDSGILILAIVEPFGYCWCRFASEFVSIKVPNKILCCATSIGSARVNVTKKHPFVAHFD